MVSRLAVLPLAVLAALSCAGMTDAIRRLDANRVAITNSLARRGVQCSGGLNTVAEEIDRIPDTVPYDWDAERTRRGWPDIEAVLDSDTHNYPGKQIELITDASDTTVLKGGVAYLTSDGDFIESSSNYTKTWDRTKDIAVASGQYKVRWILSFSSTTEFNDACINAVNDGGSELSFQLLWYANSSATTRNLETSTWHGFTGCKQIVRINGRLNVHGAYSLNTCNRLETICGKITFKLSDLSRMFQGCNSLTGIDADVVFSNEVTTTAMMFHYCYSLIKIPPHFIFPRSTNMQSMFDQCASLRSLPDGFTAAESLSTANMFNYCKSLERIPDGFSAAKSTNTSAMFSECGSLSSLPDGFSVPESQNTFSMFNKCLRLSTVPSGFSSPKTANVGSMFMSCSLGDGELECDWPNVTSVGAFRDCTFRISTLRVPKVTGALSLGFNTTYWPVVLDAPNATSMSSDNPSKSDILPKYANITCSWSIPCGYLVQKYKSNFAKFDGSGNLADDCMVSSLPTVSGKTLTLTGANTFKSWFSTSEQSKISAALSAKGWTLVW